MNTKYANTEKMNRLQNIRIEVWKYKVAVNVLKFE